MTFELILGPMFSGKTTELIKIYHENKNTKKILVMNFINDNRYDNENYVVSHDSEKIKCLKLDNFDNINIDDFDLFLLDEGHFFNKKILLNFIKKIISKNKSIHVFSINGDINLNMLDTIQHIFPYATNIIFKQGKCFECNKIGNIHKRIKISEKLNDSVLEVGSDDIYSVRCYKHC